MKSSAEGLYQEPSNMLRAQFGSSNYASAAPDGHRGARGGGARGGGNRQHVIEGAVQAVGENAAVMAGELRERARNEGDELRMKSAHHKRSPECEGPVRWLDY